MPLKVYDTQDAVPDDERDEYVEHEGKWHPKVTIELAAERKKRAQILSEKKEAERLQKEAQDKLDAAERAAEAAKKGISEDELQKIRDAEAAARRPIEEERDRLKAENRKLKLTDRVQSLALKHGVMADRIEDAMLALERRTDLGDSDGIIVKDKDGGLTAETIEHFLSTTFKAEKPWLYSGSGASGSGSDGSHGPGTAPAPKVPDTQVASHRATVAGAF